MCQKLKSPNQPCDFIKVPQSEPINALMRARKIEYEKSKVNKYNLKRSFLCGSNRKVIVTISDLDEDYKFSESTKKTLAFLLWKFQESQSQNLEFVLKDFCQFCNLRDTTKARRTLQKELELMSGLEITWEGSIPIKNEKTRESSRPSEPIRRTISLIKSGSCSFPRNRSESKYQLSLSNEFYKMLQTWGFMYVPSPLFQFNTRNHPNIISLGWSLCSYLNMNHQKEEWCLTLESLIDMAGMISYQEEKEDNWEYKKRLLEPMIKTLDDLRNTCGLAYAYFQKNGIPVSEQEEDVLLNLDYPIKDFIKLKVYFAFPDIPKHQTKTKRSKAPTHKKKKSGQSAKKSADDPLFLSSKLPKLPIDFHFFTILFFSKTLVPCGWVLSALRMGSWCLADGKKNFTFGFWLTYGINFM